MFFLSKRMGPYSTTWCSLRSLISGIGRTISDSIRTIWNLSAVIHARPFSFTGYTSLVTVHPVGLVVPLFEVHDPTRLTAPIAEALTLDVEIVPHVGMEDEGQR